MVGDLYEGMLRESNKKQYRPMDQAGLQARVEKYTGTTFPELAELAPEVLKLDAATQHWFTDRTRAAYNAGKGGQPLPTRKRDAEVAEAVGPANFASYFQRVFDVGKAQRETEKAKQSHPLNHDLF